ncbi:MAG: TauD/TfdA family dioxygenase [Alphaproteobacteria bacterium]|nr:TauD/TfdA family dioxygenase [Alphaproteobacteria bacterium]
MSPSFELETPLPGANFAGRLRPVAARGAHAIVEAAEREPGLLTEALAKSEGLLLIQGLDEIAREPELLLRLSRLFGPEIENYRENLTPPNFWHETVPEILVLSNKPPCLHKPPKRPDPPLTADGKFPTQFPHRKGWHTDQSYRRPPPDVSLFYAVTPVAKEAGQTIFANGTLAYEALSSELKAKVDKLEGLHCYSAYGRNREAALKGETPPPLERHQRSQRQPVVRVHPVTGRRSLYICEQGQMDFIDGPIIGMEKGPNGDGEKLLFQLMKHMTSREFIYVHEWTRGDLLVWDNRCLVHAATWYDAEKEERLMWRTTVSGNPGALYAGEKKSWIAEGGAQQSAAM